MRPATFDPTITIGALTVLIALAGFALSKGIVVMMLTSLPFMSASGGNLSATVV